MVNFIRSSDPNVPHTLDLQCSADALTHILYRTKALKGDSVSLDGKGSGGAIVKGGRVVCVLINLVEGGKLKVKPADQMTPITLQARPDESSQQTR